MEDEMYCIKFLKLNGFEKIEVNSYVNKACNVVFGENHIAIANNSGYTYYITGYNIYELIGYLTYHNYIWRLYKTH